MTGRGHRRQNDAFGGLAELGALVASPWVTSRVRGESTHMVGGLECGCNQSEERR